MSIFLADGNQLAALPFAQQLKLPSSPRKGYGGLPRVLTLAIEKVDYYFYHPKDIPFLFTIKNRQRRTEIRQSCILVLKALLMRLDLTTMKCVVPDPTFGLVDIDMKRIMKDTGLRKRRAERAMSLLKLAGFLETSQPRILASNGRYYGCRAVRELKPKLFYWLGIGKVLSKERQKAQKRTLNKHWGPGHSYTKSFVDARSKSSQKPTGTAEEFLEILKKMDPRVNPKPLPDISDIPKPNATAGFLQPLSPITTLERNQHPPEDGLRYQGENNRPQPRPLPLEMMEAMRKLLG